MNSLTDYGLTTYIQSNGLPAETTGRIIKQTNYTFTVVTMDGVIDQVKQKRTKKEKKKHAAKETYVIGDYVSIYKEAEHTFIKGHHLRKNVLSKQVSQEKKSHKHNAFKQLIASNIDKTFITIASDQRFTLGKLERYLMTFTIPGAELVVLITKADNKEQTYYLQKLIESSDLDVVPKLVSIYDETSIEKIQAELEMGCTAILLGASGTGKSTLINQLLGKPMERTNGVRTDGKGKHTTTHSSLIALPGGAYLIDTPGFKSIAPTKEVSDLHFEDILELAKYCKFRDCSHKSEPHCAVKQAIETGTLSQRQLTRYHTFVK